MLTCITTHQFKILKQLNQCIKKILPFEFLTTWKDVYINNTLTFLDSNDQNKVYCGIILFHQLSKIYSYESAERKQMYFNIFKSVHNKFLHILSQISNCNDATQCQFIYKIIKIYPKNFNQCQFPNCFESINSFDKFVQYLFYFIQTPINSGVTTHNGDGVLPQWKVKQIVYKFIEVIVNKQFPHSSSKKNLNDVEQYFITKFSEKLILTITTIYSNVSESHKYVDNKCRYYIYYIMASLINKRIYHYKLIEMFSNSNNSNTMLMQIINDNQIPNKELELFVNEPKSYVMNNIDNELSYSTLRNAVYKFVYTLFMFKENKEHNNNNNTSNSNSNTTLFNIFFPKFLDILNTNEPHVKNEIALATTTTSSHIDTTNIQHNLIKESILYLFQCLNEIISTKSPTSIEHIIETFILPEFTSPFGFMRERSCTFIEMLKGHKLHNTTLIINITKSICALLQNEKCLPVRVMSALAAPTLLQYKNVQHLLRGNIKVLLTLYIKLLNEIGTEEIIECIQEIIKCFSNEVREYTEHLCDYLVKYFISLNKNDNSEMDNILIAKQVILTMVDIVKLFINDNDIYLKIEKYINMIILFTLNKDNITYLEEGIDLIYAVIKKKKTIPHVMWNYYTFLLKGVIDEHTVHKTLNNANSNDNNNIRHVSVSHSWCCCDNINKVLKIIMYYIIKDNDVFLKDISIDTSLTASTTTTNVTYCQYTVDYVNLLMLLCESDRDYSTMKVLVNILGIMFEKLKGQIEQYVLQYISLIYNKITNNSSKCMKSNKYKLILCDLLSHIFIYDPLLLFKNDVHVSTLIINFVLDIIDKSNTKAQYVKNTILLCSMLLAGNNSDIVKLSNEHIVKIVKGIYLLISKSYDMKSKQSYLIDVDNEFEIEAERLKNMNFDVDGDDNYDDYDLNAKVDELEAFCEEVQRKRKYDDTEDDIDDDDDNDNNEDDEVYLLGLDDEDEDGDTHEELVCQIMKQNNIIWVKDTLNLIAEKNKQYMCKIKEVCGDDLINKINNVIINEENRIKVGCSSKS